MENINEIDELVKLISRLPGLGPKSAKRIFLKLINTREEVPHSVAVNIEKIKEIKRDKDKNFTAILATIIVERTSQKGILIGKKGSMLKTIGQTARSNMKKLINGPVHLELFVKVVPNWRKKESKLMELGYEVDY